MAVRAKAPRMSAQHKATVKALENIVTWQVNHAEEDKKHFSEIATLLKKQPTKEDLEQLATKNDVAEVLVAWKNLKLGAMIVTGGGKWTFRFILALAALFGAWAVFKGGVVALVAGIFHGISKLP